MNRLSRLLERLDRALPLSVVLWAFPIIFVVHDLEEVLTMESFAREHLRGLPEPLATWTQITTAEFSTSVLLLLAVCVAGAYAGTRTPPARRGMGFLTLLIAVLLVNVFTHLGQAILLRGYAPGVITAVTVALPYSLYALRRILNEGGITRRDLIRILPIGAVLVLPSAVLALAFGKLAGLLLGI